jgi:hypothetical protein
MNTCNATVVESVIKSDPPRFSANGLPCYALFGAERVKVMVSMIVAILINLARLPFQPCAISELDRMYL